MFSTTTHCVFKARYYYRHWDSFFLNVYKIKIRPIYHCRRKITLKSKCSVAHVYIVITSAVCPRVLGLFILPIHALIHPEWLPALQALFVHLPWTAVHAFSYTVYSLCLSLHSEMFWNTNIDHCIIITCSIQHSNLLSRLVGWSCTMQPGFVRGHPF